MAVIAGVGCLAFAASALGVPSAPGPPATSTPPNQTEPWTFTWSLATAEPGEEIDGYVGGATASGNDEPVTDLGGASATSATVAVAETDRFFRVAARLADGTRGEYATVAITPDFTPPSLSLALQPASPNGLNGWYTSLQIVRTCDDGMGSGVAACGNLPWSEDRESAPFTTAVTDRAGNTSAPASTPAFKFDATRPNPPPAGGGATSLGQPLSPGAAALVADEPVFTWTRGSDARSGVARYELRWRLLDEEDWTTIATNVQDPPVGDPSAIRAASADPLPVKTPFEWQVVTFDKAGNSRGSSRQQLTIDPTIPPPPSITSGPAVLTRVSSPSFTWSGSGQTYLWDLTVAGAQNPIRQSGGPQTSATIPNLPDGDYTFRVFGVSEAGRRSAEATHSFKIDTTPPPPPTILVRPPFPTISAAIFSWETEAGAYSRWTVLDGAGAAVVPSTDTVTTSATLPAFANGAYSFQLQQIDAAGNVSAATVEPFTVLAPLVPAPGPSGLAATLPRQNAVRLKPKAGLTVPTRVPVLRWTRGPKGTKLYNVQVFKVVKRRGKAPRIRKVLSVFPRGLQMRAPRAKLATGTCYVWRVWPYTGRSFTPKPVGVSNFCVASAKVITAKKKQARARKLAIARAAKR